MAAKWPIFVLRHVDFGENLKKKKKKKKKKKNTFSKVFHLNEIWIIIGDHEYINIAEIKIGNFYSGGILGAKYFSCTPHANLC